MPVPAQIAVAGPAFPALPPELVIALRKRAKVSGAAVLIGRRLGDDAYVDVLATEGAPRIDGHTLFAVDGITETITALLLAEGVRRGEVRLDEPVDELHSADFHPPARGSSPLTLADLATHRAGFPAVPLREAAQPYAAIDRAAFVKLVNEAPATRPASGYAPSVLDYALLGTLLADRAGTSYAALARERVFVPPRRGVTARWSRPAACARAPSTCCGSPARCLPTTTGRWRPTCGWPERRARRPRTVRSA